MNVQLSKDSVVHLWPHSHTRNAYVVALLRTQHWVLTAQLASVSSNWGCLTARLSYFLFCRFHRVTCGQMQWLPGVERESTGREEGLVFEHYTCLDGTPRCTQWTPPCGVTVSHILFWWDSRLRGVTLGLEEWQEWGSLATNLGCIVGGSPGVEQRMGEDITTTRHTLSLFMPKQKVLIKYKT